MLIDCNLAYLAEPAPDSDTEDEWPPFRKTGVFDPYSDDPRLAVKRVVLCALSGTLVVAGTAGHVVIAKFDTEVLDGELKITTMNIVSDRDGFVWKGHDQLSPKQGKQFIISKIRMLHIPGNRNNCLTYKNVRRILKLTKPDVYFLVLYRRNPPAERIPSHVRPAVAPTCCCNLLRTTS